MYIVASAVRQHARHVLVDGCGTDVTARRVDHLKGSLQSALESLGYRQRIYIDNPYDCMT